ncbi:MAG TPA: YceI family protein [Rhizomicrobium sp.]|jgi:polyisoprenoid-binding protein YceI
MKHILLAAAFFFAAAPAYAAHWNVDYAKSKLGFTATWSKQPFTAQFKSWKAAIDFDPADLAHAKADVAIALTSEASSGGDEFDDAIKGAQGFAVAQFATAHFVTTGFRATGGNGYVATGTLSLHGVTKPVTLPFTLTITGKIAHMVGTAALLRTDYGVGQATTDPVAHEVTVNIDITAVQQ